MNYFDYSPKETSEAQKDIMIHQLLDNVSFSYGDLVKLAGDDNSPAMVVTEMRVQTTAVAMYKLERMFLEVACKYYSKGKQTFISERLPVMCLKKVVIN